MHSGFDAAEKSVSCAMEKVHKLEAQAEADALTIMKLKAKLCDLMNEREG